MMISGYISSDRNLLRGRAAFHLFRKSDDALVDVVDDTALLSEFGAR